MLFLPVPDQMISPEEFGIYLNYVRKLGFEEAPDYEFLRELFAKVLKNMGEVEDDVYDWNLLNNGRGWESQVRHKLFYSDRLETHHFYFLML